MQPLKAFVDDTTVLASDENQAHQMVERLDELKSRSLPLRKSKVRKVTRFHVRGQKIPPVSEEPVKSVGRRYDDSLKDTKLVKETNETMDNGLNTIDHCRLPGKHKVWCLPHMLIPMLLWPLLIYEISTTAVEAMDAKINKFTRKWLGVPPCLTNVAPYCRQARLRLPLKSLIEEYKCGKARLLRMLENSVTNPSDSSNQP